MTIRIADLTSRPGLATTLARLGRRILSLTAGTDAQLAGLPVSRLTVTVGLGPAVVHDLLGPTAPGAQDLPRFGREEIPAEHRGGDLLIQVCADDPAIATLADQSLATALGTAATTRWQSNGVRGFVDASGARNLLGFYDGVNVPRTQPELDHDVWLDGPAAVRGGTIAVVRLIRLDIGRFTRQPVVAQERAIGRRRSDGAPLSGGAIGAAPDLNAKTDDGRYLIPVDAHVRRAHPLPSGADGLMLRRSYSYAHGAGDQGLIFISFQQTLRTFVRTQQRLDEQDALMAFATTTASGTFLILPGFDSTHSLGSTLFSR